MEESAPKKVSENDISAHTSFTWVGYHGFCLGGVGVLHNDTFFIQMHSILDIVTLVCYAETSGPDPQHIINILVAVEILMIF